MPQPVTDAMELGLVMELLAGPTLLEPIRGRGHLPREERLGGKDVIKVVGFAWKPTQRAN